MSEAVKRYDLQAFPNYTGMKQTPSGRYVLAADHDRIVSSLTEAGVRMQAERDRLAERCRELEAEKRLLVANELEFGKVAEKSVATIDALRAEVERLRIALSRAGAWIEAAPHGENCFVSSHYDGDPGSRCNCGKDSAQESIESAMEASR